MEIETKVRNFVNSFRDKIEPYWSPDLFNDKFKWVPNMPNSAGYCGPSSVLLLEKLIENFPEEIFSAAVGRVYFDRSEWIIGKHVWVVWHHKLKTATIIDITADQSGKIDTKIIFENIDELAKRGINYIPYQLERDIEKLDESPKRRANILKGRLVTPK